MGFLTGGCRDDITLLFEQLATDQLRIEQRTMLRVEETSEKLFTKTLAVNEVAIQRSGSGMIAVECSIDNQSVATFYGDGMIVATPTGSTAYSLSAGGPVVAPGCRCLILSPLASHNLTMRPIVVPDTSSIRLRVRARRSSVTLSIDNTAYEIADGTEITVTCSEKRIFLAQVHNISFYDTLRDKMMWGIDIRD
jgi:NAD+ kinase